MNEPENLSIVTMTKYVDTRFDSLHRYIDAKVDSIEQATRVVANNVNVRFESVNEFRAALSDQSKTFITRTEHAKEHEVIMMDIRELREARAEARGKASQGQVLLAWILAVIGIMIGLINLSFNIKL